MARRICLKNIFLILMFSVFLFGFIIMNVYKKNLQNKGHILYHTKPDYINKSDYESDFIDKDTSDLFENKSTSGRITLWKNLLEEPKIQFDPNFKNPCWFTGRKLNCLPYFFVIGVKKCGTTDIFFRLALHPDVTLGNFKKESQWFARRRFSAGGFRDNFKFYIEQFDKAAQKILEMSNNTGGTLSNHQTITGEGSPSNLHLNSHWTEMKGNENLDEPKYVILDYIHHFIPQAKIIITFRDPIERLYSDYYHEFGKRKSVASPVHFHFIVKHGLKFYEECFKTNTIRSCVYNPDLYRRSKMQMQLGIYYIYWIELTRLFPRDQILVLHTNDLKDKSTSMARIYKFLGLRALSPKEMQHVINAKEKNKRNPKLNSRGPMLNETYELLKSFYNPFNERMADLMGDRRFLYTAG